MFRRYAARGDVAIDVTISRRGAGCQAKNLECVRIFRPAGRSVPCSTDPPPGMIPVSLPKRCGLFLTHAEYIRGLKRGKWWKRRQAMLARVATRQDALGSTISQKPIPS